MTLADISSQPRTLRSAVAGASLRADAAAIERLCKGDLAAGDPLPAARFAAIQAAKTAFQLIPACHMAPIDHVAIDFTIGADRIDITAEVKAIHRTGVETQALTAATVAALTLYDMLKTTGADLSIEAVKLLSQKGGNKPAGGINIRGGILVISDSVFAGTKSDGAGTVIAARLAEWGVTHAAQKIVPDDALQIADTIAEWCDEAKLDLIITTGGTGIGPRDVTPEAIAPLLTRRLGGVEETMRAHGQDRVPTAMLSRSLAGQRGTTVVVCLPGAPKGVAESLDAILPALLHAVPIMAGGGH